MKIQVLLFSMILLPLAAAMAEESGFYFKTEAGPAFMENPHVDMAAQGFDLKTKTGVRLDLVGGYTVNKYLSVELNAAMVRTELIDNGATTYYQVPLMANVVGKYPVAKLEPYIGCGIGGVEVLADNHGYIDDGAQAFGAQAMTGLQYRIGGHASLGLGYKFLYVTQVHFFGADFGPGLTHSVLATVTCHF